MPGAKLQAARKELHETREWLAAVQGKNTLPSPHRKTPVLKAPPDPPGSQSSESGTGDLGDKVGDKADEDKTDAPPQSDGERGTKVLEADQVKHPLKGGQWEGLGAIHKVAEIHIEVRVSVGHRRRNSADTQYRPEWCSPP